MHDKKPVAVLTGAASDGIGTAILRRLVADDFDVYGSYEPQDKESAERLAEEMPSAHLSQIDHADRSALDGFIASLPADAKVRALVNGQFYFELEDPDALDFSIWDRSLAINLTAPAYLFSKLRDKFLPDAAVVTITSTEAFVGSFGASAYAATKAAIHNLTMTLANTSGSMGVRVNALAAGWIGGVMDTDEVFNMSREVTPLGRLGDPSEIAAVVAFLLSHDASFINGSVLTVDGGYSGVDTIAKYEFESARAK